MTGSIVDVTGAARLTSDGMGNSLKAVALSPSPGTPGEGWGEGSGVQRSVAELCKLLRTLTQPLPEYRERSKTIESDAHSLLHFRREREHVHRRGAAALAVAVLNGVGDQLFRLVDGVDEREAVGQAG